MITRDAKVGSKLGLHARPAANFARAAEATGYDISITFNDSTVDAASLLEVMTLGAEYGDTVTLTCEDDASESAIDGLVVLLSEETD